jgi:23S rRNA G2445 N2-methylase RlmL
VDTIVFEILPGLERFACDELQKRLPKKKCVFAPSQQKGEERIETSLPLETFFDLRVSVSASLALLFPIDRPRALLNEKHLNRIERSARRILKLQKENSFSGLRIAAAGSKTAVMQRLQEVLAEKLHLTADQEDGDFVVRIRKGAEGGWEVLLRLTPRPLATRPWRVENYRGALNATVAAVAVMLTRPQDGDRVLNLMCGSGTMLIERALMAKSAHLVGVDCSEEALRCARKNVGAAGVSDRVDLIHGDIGDSGIVEALTETPFDAIFSDLPWGEAIGSRKRNVDLYQRFVTLLPECLASSGKVVAITQDVELFQKVLDDSPYRVQGQFQYFQGGFHPTMFLLREG